MVRAGNTCNSFGDFKNRGVGLFQLSHLQIVETRISLRMSEVDLENELIAAGQDEETAFYKVSAAHPFQQPLQWTV